MGLAWHYRAAEPEYAALWRDGHAAEQRRTVPDTGGTPTHGSWLNQVERWFGLHSERQIKRGAHCSVAELKRAIQEFLDQNNKAPKPFVWTKTADNILASIARFAQRTFETR
jgi:hypothetical protein